MQALAAWLGSARPVDAALPSSFDDFPQARCTNARGARLTRLECNAMRYSPSAIALILWASSLQAQWPQFRGPNGSGILDTTELAVTFGPIENVRWEAVVPAGKSSPIVTDGRLFLTAHEGQSLLVDKYGILHEMNTPLGSLRSASGYLEAPSPKIFAT